MDQEKSLIGAMGLKTAYNSCFGHHKNMWGFDTHCVARHQVLRIDLSTGHLFTIQLSNLGLLGVPAWWSSDDDPQVPSRFVLRMLA